MPVLFTAGLRTGTAVLAPVVFGTMVAARRVPVIQAICVGTGLVGALLARTMIIAVAAVLARRLFAIGHSEHRGAVDVVRAFGWRLVPAFGRMARTLIAAIGAARCVRPPLAGMTLGACVARAMAISAHVLAIVSAMIAWEGRNGFAADIVDDLDRLFHHTLDRPDFLAF